jgi:hypothetical protein
MVVVCIGYPVITNKMATKPWSVSKHKEELQVREIYQQKRTPDIPEVGWGGKEEYTSPVDRPHPQWSAFQTQKSVVKTSEQPAVKISASSQVNGKLCSRNQFPD